MQTKCNRGIDSFTEEECWRLFRFRKCYLAPLFQSMIIPYRYKLKGDQQ